MGDYTVKFEMVDDIIESFKKDKEDIADSESPALEFKKYLMKKIQEVMIKHRRTRLKKMEKKMHKIFPEYLPLKNLKEEKEDHDDYYEPMDE